MPIRFVVQIINTVRHRIVVDEIQCYGIKSLVPHLRMVRTESPISKPGWIWMKITKKYKISLKIKMRPKYPALVLDCSVHPGQKGTSNIMESIDEKHVTI